MYTVNPLATQNHSRTYTVTLTLLEQIHFLLTVVFGILEPLFVKYKQSMGFLVPATDSMAAILSLYMEVFAYGIFILLLVTYCIDVCITEYSAECSAWDVEHDSIYVEYLRDITRTYAKSRHWNSRPKNA
jgi:hypothetical protein